MKGYAFPVDPGWRQLYRRAPNALNAEFPQQRVLLIGISLFINVKNSQRIILKGSYLRVAASPVKGFIQTSSSHSSRSELAVTMSLASVVFPATGNQALHTTFHQLLTRNWLVFVLLDFDPGVFLLVVHGSAVFVENVESPSDIVGALSEGTVGREVLVNRCIYHRERGVSEGEADRFILILESGVLCRIDKRQVKKICRMRVLVGRGS